MGRPTTTRTLNLKWDSWIRKEMTIKEALRFNESWHRESIIPNIIWTTRFYPLDHNKGKMKLYSVFDAFSYALWLVNAIFQISKRPSSYFGWGIYDTKHTVSLLTKLTFKNTWDTSASAIHKIDATLHKWMKRILWLRIWNDGSWN